MQSGDWVLLNAREGIVEGGPFTRADPATGRESCLDLWLCSAGLAPHIKSLDIDSTRKKWAVARPVRRNRKLQLVHSDHYTLLGVFHNLRATNEGRKEQVEARWNLPEKEG